jgi:hypothetical protein
VKHQETADDFLTCIYCGARFRIDRPQELMLHLRDMRARVDAIERLIKDLAEDE